MDFQFTLKAMTILYFLQKEQTAMEEVVPWQKALPVVLKSSLVIS